MAFGKEVTWIGFDPKQARQIAESLRQKSYIAEREPEPDVVHKPKKGK